MATELTIHGTGSGTCSLTGRTGDGLTVSFQDGTVTESFLSWKGFQQLLALKAGKNGKPIPPAAAAGSGTTTTTGRGTTNTVGISTGQTESVATGHGTSGGTTSGSK